MRRQATAEQKQAAEADAADASDAFLSQADET